MSRRYRRKLRRTVSRGLVRVNAASVFGEIISRIPASQLFIRNENSRHNMSLGNSLKPIFIHIHDHIIEKLTSGQSKQVGSSRANRQLVVNKCPSSRGGIDLGNTSLNTFSFRRVDVVWPRFCNLVMLSRRLR
ncbi:unnamed protein product [Protopolystoma xenopodis]|uniref:Uncharacterized protein n=1 Tax=Protopolystoma xenopodis TaxID=117903 RepID=A0A3S5BVH7_9PLAT|nr:unnamed protein product [Protopolystoma xenopodis]